MIHRAKILSIKLSHEKGSNRVLMSSGTLKVGMGLVGDAYSKPGDRQVCIMSKNTRDKLDKYRDGLCVKRFVETLCIDIDSDQIIVGDVIDFGGAKVEVTGKGKRCFPQCDLVKRSDLCALTTDVIFAEVIRSGEIQV